MRQYTPIAPPASAPETTSDENVGGTTDIHATIHENPILVNGLGVDGPIETAEPIDGRNAGAAGTAEPEAAFDMLRAAVRACFTALVDVAQREVDDDRLARAVARGAVGFLEKRLAKGMLLVSAEQAVSLLYDVTRMGCGVFIAELALIEDELAKVWAVIDARPVELCRPARLGSITLPGRAHVEALRERVAELAVRGALPIFTSDDERLGWLRGISKNLRREGARLDVGHARGRGRESGGAASVFVGPDDPSGSFPCVSDRPDEQVDTARAARYLYDHYPDVVAYTFERDGAEAVPTRERVHAHRRRRAARDALAAKGFTTP